MGIHCGEFVKKSATINLFIYWITTQLCMQVFLVVLKNARTLKATTLEGFSFKFAQLSRQYLAENK